VKKVPAPLLAFLFFTSLFAATAVATLAQPDCAALNAAKGEGKFTGQISTPPDGNSFEVTYGDQTVLVRYNTSVTVCQGGQPASLDTVIRGASVSVFGPMRRNGKNLEIDAARIFVAGPPQTARPGAQQAQPNAPPAQPPRRSFQPPPPNAQPAQPFRPRSEPAPLNTPTQQAPPRITPIRPIPNSVILRGGTYAETMQRLRVVRTYALPNLRTSPQVTLGPARLDFRPMLNNPKTLFNIAERLRQLPQHVQVIEASSEVSEVEDGLVIHHVLTYRILPGKCSDPDATAQLARAGIQCFTRASANERVAEFSQAGSPRYLANPEKRQAAIAAFQRNSALADADVTKHIADLRAMLANPTQRATIVAQVGQAEAARMDTLSDDQLKEEMINSGVQRFEETMFVPKLESAVYAHPQDHLAIAPSPAEMADVQQLLRDGVPAHGGTPSGYPKLLKIFPAAELNHFVGSAAPAGDKAADLKMGPYFFLTGFTVGHDYEWNWGVQITINWCLVGCSSTYGISLNAGFNYAFGLRFPIQTEFNYQTVVHPNNSADAKVTATFEPIQGTVDDFFAAGLSGDQMYDAKELVAQVGADAGYSVNLPVLSGSNSFSVGVDFTNMLPSPYTGGKFQPPAPGTGGINSPFVLNGVDLLGGLLDFGVVGGQVFPAVNINLHSDKLQFTLNDEILKRQTPLTSTGQTVSLGVMPTTVGKDSHFSIGDPVYNLGFTLTPGLAPSVFVDIAVWSDQWTWPVWFPQLAIDLPPNGVDFGCHAGTTCVIDFEPAYNPATGQIGDVKKEMDAADRTLRGGGCQPNGPEGNYLCPVKGMLGLCNAMLKNGAVLSCGPLVPTSTDQILKRGHCTGDNAAYVCPSDMIGLCNLYLKNEVILSCTLKK
jgi:hypothetical protein